MAPRSNSCVTPPSRARRSDDGCRKCGPVLVLENLQHARLLVSQPSTHGQAPSTEQRSRNAMFANSIMSSPGGDLCRVDPAQPGQSGTAPTGNGHVGTALQT